MVDFLVIGHISCINYNNIHPLVINGKFSFGWNRVVEFENGVKFGNIRWFSNISDYKPGNFEFKRDYVEGYFKRFDECPDCINIDRKDDIPDGYYGMMGIPVSAVMYINRDQFDILGVVHRGVQKYDLWTPYVEGEFKFSRWIIRRKKDGRFSGDRTEDVGNV